MNAEKWQKINELFHESLDVEAENRLRFLHEKSGGDEKIFAEVQKLISAHEEADSFIQKPVADDALEVLSNENSATIVAESAKDILVGEKISHFEIVEKIGKGGMGEVFLARDESLERDVAIKILLPEFTADEFRLQRFRLEAQAASALNHPNILTIYEIGETENFSFMAAEYVKGKTLNNFLQTEKTSLQDILKISTQIVSALQSAHEAGIVHRDIKHDNIMIRQDGIVKVLDFGLAKLLENKEQRAKIKDHKSTAVGLIMGTPQFMSPEQARGKNIDYQTDIFSFGVVLYQMLSGKLPFTGETTNDIIAAILTKEAKSLHEINADVPTELEKIVAKCLEKDKQKRYRNATNLLADLEGFAEDLKIQNRLEKTFTPNRAEVKTEILHFTTADNVENTVGMQNANSGSKSVRNYLAAGIAAVLLSVAGFFGYQYFSPSKQIKSVAVLPFVNESGNQEIEYLSDGMTDVLIRNLSQIPNLDVKARSSVFRYKGKEIDLKKIASELNAQAILTGRFVQRNDQIALSLEIVDPTTDSVIWTENYNRKQSDLVSLQTDVARDVSNGLKAKLSGAETAKISDNGTSNSQAYQSYLKGRYFLTKGSSTAPQDALKYFQESVSIDPKFALGYAGLADCYSLVGTLMQSKVNPSETVEPAKIAAEKAIELNPNLSEAYVSLAWIKFRYDWDWTGAEKDFKKAIELNPNNAQAHQWYGELLACLRRDEEAIAEYKKAVALEPFNLLMLWNLAKGYQDIERFDEAITEARKIYEMDKNFRRNYRVLRQSYEGKKMYPEAFGIFIQEAELTKMPPERIEMYKQIYKNQGYKVMIKTSLENSLKEDKNLTASLKAVYYRAIEDKDAMFYWLEEVYKQRQSSVLYLQFSAYNFVKDDPRYQELLRKMNFPK